MKRTVEKVTFIRCEEKILKGTNLSCKSKIILFLLLQGVKYNEISCFVKEQKDSINSAFKELKQYGYLQILKCREKTTGKFKENIYLSTTVPNFFEWSVINEYLEENNLTY